MIKRTLEISTDGHRLSIRNDQLILERDREQVGSVPCEDIGLLIVESKATTFTHDVLVRITEHGGLVVLCGSDHHPTALCIPVAGNETQTQRIRAQATAKQPKLKQMWRQIVQAKIRQQASTIPQDHEATRKLLQMAATVQSGDPTNMEAQAARSYWPVLFDDPSFRRNREGPPPNNLLNYGYMALRAATGRAICGAGLHPSLGISHHNKYNPFCLADDLMEPYRPFVDWRVLQLWRSGKTTIERETKADLLQTLTDTVTMGGTSGPLMVGLSRTASSVVNVLMGEEEKLALPES